MFLIYFYFSWLDQHAREKGSQAYELLTLVKTLPALLKCGNCNEEECLDGQTVSVGKLREGLKVKPNMSRMDWANGDGALRFKIVSNLLDRSYVHVRVKEEQSQCEVTHYSFLNYELGFCYNC